MPRYTISKNQDQFNTLYEMLATEKDKKLTDEVWNLILMLATNDEKYREVLEQLDGIKHDEQFAQLFDKENEYHKLYTRDILMKLMVKQNMELEPIELSDEFKKTDVFKTRVDLSSQRAFTKVDAKEFDKDMRLNFKDFEEAL